MSLWQSNHRLSGGAMCHGVSPDPIHGVSDSVTFVVLMVFADVLGLLRVGTHVVWLADKRHAQVLFGLKVPTARRRNPGSPADGSAGILRSSFVV